MSTPTSHNRSLVVRGLPSSASEIYAAIAPYLSSPHSLEHIRIVRDKAGLSKGVAIISCADNQVAISLTRLSGSLLIDFHPVFIEPSVEQRQDDWVCAYCNVRNYHWRMQCFKCLVPKYAGNPQNINNPSSTSNNKREEASAAATASTLEGSQDTSPTPTKFLLIQSLWAKVTAEDVFQALKPDLETLLRVWIVNDKQTLTSRRFAFLEFPIISEAESALEMLTVLVDASLAKICDATPKFSYARDLYVLNSVFLKGPDNPFLLSHWDPLLALSPFPAPDSNLEAPSSTTKTKAYSILPIPPPNKKIKMQFKVWEAKAPTEELSPSPPPTTIEDHTTQSQNVQLLNELEDFESFKELQVHGHQSEEHQIRLEAYLELATKKQQEQDLETLTGEKTESLRDRAAERRSIFGQSSPGEQPELLPNPKEEDDSIGSKLLKKLGWVEGQGLGPDGKGIINPIKAIKSSRVGAGLGSAALEVAQNTFFGDHPPSSLVYREKARKSFREKWNQAQE